MSFCSCFCSCIKDCFINYSFCEVVTIQIIEGVPGSGKSYFMVKYLQKNFTYDDFYQVFSVKDNYLVISNIDGLKIPHIRLDGPELLGNLKQGVKGKYKREEFFTVANFEKLMSVKRVSNVLLLIDEAQHDDLFPITYKDPDVMFFFQYHRHIGVDITLGTQNCSQISRVIVVLAEYIARAAPRSKTILGNFSYQFCDIKGNFLYSKTLRKDKEVFSAYKNMSVDEVHKPKNAVLHWILFSVVAFFVVGICFKFALAIVKNKSESGKRSRDIPAHRLHPSAVPGPSSPVSNIQKQVSSSHVPLSSVSSLPPVPVYCWRRYPVDGYIKDGNKQYFMIAGQLVDNRRCRRFSRPDKTVEYYGEDLRQGRSLTSVAPAASPNGVATEPRAEAVAVAPVSHDTVVRPAGDYERIPPGHDIKREFVESKSVHQFGAL